MIDIQDKTVAELRELKVKGLIRVVEIPEYHLWHAMQQRCNDPGRDNYRWYGGRGISICPEWKKDFWAWFQHIGRRPRVGFTQDRIDNDKGYQPGNVRWATYKVQANNQRRDKIIKVTEEDVGEIRSRRGVESQADTAFEFGISRSQVGAIQLGLSRNTEGLYERPPKMRAVCGERSANAILTEFDVANIKGLLLNPWPGFLAELARRYNVTVGTIWAIAHGVNWAHVQPSPNPVMPPPLEPTTITQRRWGL